MPRGVAWRHAVVLGLLSAGAMYWALANNISHGYWIAVTLVVALRPLPEQRANTLRDRLLGTVVGAVIALAVIVLLPTLVGAVLGAVFLVLLATYSMGGSYFMQTVFLTPMLLIFATLGDEDKGIQYRAGGSTTRCSGSASGSSRLLCWTGGTVPPGICPLALR